MVKNNNFNDVSIHFIGIGGVSMSALANLMLSFGVKVSGSDKTYNPLIAKLQSKGCKIYIGHSKDNISPNTNLVVFTGAIKEDNVELVEAKKQSIKVMERSEFLGWVANQYKNVISISGTHGKTTTTAMLSDIFMLANINPTVHVGGESKNINGNLLIGSKDFFITEACEYRNSFRFLNSSTSVVTNIDLDHTDCYENLGQVVDAFSMFVNNTQNNVVVFENSEFANHIKSGKRVISCGFNGEFDVKGYNLQKHKNGCYSFDVNYNNVYVGKFLCGAVGEHNAKNALCAITVSLLYNIDYSVIYKAIKNFSGVKRRYEKVAEINGVPVIADYAHHPTEILNSIKSAKNTFKKILCVFQPHTFSRTLGLKEEFKNAFKGVKKLIVYKTYNAREKYIKGGGGKDLFNFVNINKNNKFYCKSQKELKQLLLTLSGECDLVLALGAGDIYEIVKKVCAKIKKSVD